MKSHLYFVQWERPGCWGLVPHSIIPGDSNPSDSLRKPGVDTTSPWMREAVCPDNRSLSMTSTWKLERWVLESSRPPLATGTR